MELGSCWKINSP